MKTIISEKIARILKNKKNLEEKLNVKITNRGREVFIEGTPENEYIAEKVIDALNFGFSFSTAILIKERNFIFEIINIKQNTNRKDLQRVRARIIGKNGKTLKTLNQLTGCNFELKDNFVGIICDPESLKNGQEAVISIIRGAKHSNVYNFLEKRMAKPVLDLGLKTKRNKKL